MQKGGLRIVKGKAERCHIQSDILDLANVEAMEAVTSPMTRIGRRATKISQASTLTGYAGMTREPGSPLNLINPKCCCDSDRISPSAIPASPPVAETKTLSHQNVHPILFLSIPMAVRVAMDCCFSMISIQMVLIILKEAIIRIKVRRRKVTHFSIETILKFISCC